MISVKLLTPLAAACAAVLILVLAAGPAAAQVLWNFNAEGDISISGEIVGSILAPRASIVATEGTIEGQSVVDRWAGTAWRFRAGVPSCPELRRR